MLTHQTPEQFAKRLNEAYKSTKAERLTQLSIATINLIESGVISDAQMRSAFGLTTADWAKQKRDMTALRSVMQLIKSARGGK